MQIHTFIAESAADAIAQIRETLGPEAVVLNVRRPPVEGLARLWQKPSIEVLAHVPDMQASAVRLHMLNELREELRAIRQKVECRQAGSAKATITTEEGSPRHEESGQGAFAADESASFQRPMPDSAVGLSEGGWRVRTLLENSGLLPLHAQSVIEELRVLHGDVAPNSLAQEIKLARNVLLSRWGKPAVNKAARTNTHVFIGPPGVGKTTCLCKWLAQTVLVEGRSASVWRLDGRGANTAEALSVFCEILGVPLERFQPELPTQNDAVLFIDLPGVNPTETAGLSTLGVQLSQLPDPQVHLVLNAAYETSLLLAQVRAFATLPIADLIITHLDEELRWGKFWNLVLGTNYNLRFLSAGQNIPGEFTTASPEKILDRQFQRK